MIFCGSIQSSRGNPASTVYIKVDLSADLVAHGLNGTLTFVQLAFSLVAWNTRCCLKVGPPKLKS
jgi:hypothetical protein